MQSVKTSRQQMPPGSPGVMGWGILVLCMANGPATTEDSLRPFEFGGFESFLSNMFPNQELRLVMMKFHYQNFVQRGRKGTFSQEYACQCMDI